MFWKLVFVGGNGRILTKYYKDIHAVIKALHATTADHVEIWKKNEKHSMYDFHELIETDRFQNLSK